MTGHLGQLAADLKGVFAGDELILTEMEDLRLEDAGRVREFVQASAPELVVNCAAYNRVDEAEDAPEAAFAANTFAVRNLALAARECGAEMVHFSTDYVFDGPGRRPYTEEDAPCPGSVYGVSKAAGEMMLQATWERHYICRVCGLYGYAGSRDKGSNFVETMLKLGAKGQPLKVVDDQILTPTSTLTVARAVKNLIGTGRHGLYHMTCEGECSWYEFAQAIFAGAGMDVEVTPVGSEAYPTKARRPRYSVLENRRLREAGLGEMPDWRAALREYLSGRAVVSR
ncbi:MAG: dTDP-4-dehydrorhamnose reductase [Acidobacteria bacterium]|nr:dTDP-4-dehydrorhamnose reductase [Acidobacteriota bacterium]